MFVEYIATASTRSERRRSAGVSARGRGARRLGALRALRGLALHRRPHPICRRIDWDSEEGHLSGFRRSPEFRSFFEAAGPFVHDINEMRHYQVTFAGER
jgi:hypothetical protein